MDDGITKKRKGGKRATAAADDDEDAFGGERVARVLLCEARGCKEEAWQAGRQGAGAKPDGARAGAPS